VVGRADFLYVADSKLLSPGNSSFIDKAGGPLTAMPRSPYFLALLVQALIERQLRLGMKRECINGPPISPEQRLCERPTTVLQMRLFSLALRHTLLRRHPVLPSTAHRAAASKPSIYSAFPSAHSWPDRPLEIHALSSPTSTE
jgi:hypothetical protein